MTSAKTLENSIYWQKHVLTHSKDPKQKERAQKAIERLTEQLKTISHVEEG